MEKLYCSKLQSETFCLAEKLHVVPRNDRMSQKHVEYSTWTKVSNTWTLMLELHEEGILLFIYFQISLLSLADKTHQYLVQSANLPQNTVWFFKCFNYCSILKWHRAFIHINIFLNYDVTKRLFTVWIKLQILISKLDMLCFGLCSNT